ncbi:glycosyltransferase [Candidatus Pacearchaeota archaeon]|nr:glycosyltransferase [Candidatus Pacearchaeota archaeon]
MIKKLPKISLSPQQATEYLPQNFSLSATSNVSLSKSDTASYGVLNPDLEIKKISIVIPAHNEEHRISPTLEAYLKYFKDLKKKKIIDFEIVVVLNACKDNTRKVVEKYKCKELIILEFERGGKGFAVIEGFKDAFKRNSDYIGFVDADMATPPDSFYDLARNIEDVEGVIPNRRDKNSKIIADWDLKRKIISRGFNLIVRTLFLLPHRDTQCGAKLFKREILEKVVPKLGSSEWSFDVDLLFYMRRENARIKSIPTVWEDKKGSRINLRGAPVKMFSSIVRLRLIHSPFRFLVRLYTKMPESLKFHHRLQSTSSNK